MDFTEKRGNNAPEGEAENNAQSAIKVDAVVVGAGPAGISAALAIKRGGKNVVVIERSEKAGTKNMFGGAVYLNSIKSILPETYKDAPYERFITGHTFSFFTNEGSTDIKSADYEDKTTATVLRPKFDAWLAEQAKKEGVFFAPKTLVKRLIMKDDAVIGVETELEKFYAPVVILADGVNSLLSRQIGLRREYFPKDMVLSVKETLKLDKNVLEERFNLEKGSDEGAMFEFFGTLENTPQYQDGKENGKNPKTPFAIGFLYTFKDSVSIGIGVSLEDLCDMKIKPHELLEQFKAQKTVKRKIEGAEICEYSAHLIPEGGFNNLQKLYASGVMVAGDAAGLLNSAHFEGTNFAIESGRLAGRTAVIALNLGNADESVLKIYEDKLKKSFVMKDMKSYRNVVETLYRRKKSVLKYYPQKMAEVMKIFTKVDNVPKSKKIRGFIKNTLTERSLVELFRDIKAFIKLFFDIVF